MHYYLTEGLEGVDREGYHNVRSVKRAVDSRVEMVRSGKVDECHTPYLVFCPSHKTSLRISSMFATLITRYFDSSISTNHKP